MIHHGRFWRRGDPAGGEATYHRSMAENTARRKPGRAGIMAVATAALVFLVTGPASAATVTVDSVNFRFQPESQTVNVGDVVRWTFAGEPHTVTSGAPGALDGRFDSGIRDPGASFQVTFATAGTFPYFCQIHPEQMVGTIVVEAATTAPPTVQPTASPTSRPTARPTATPTATPTEAPTKPPTAAPTVAPIDPPTVGPTEPATAPAPTATPSEVPASPSPETSPSAAPPISVATSPAPDGEVPAGPLDAAPILVIAVLVGLLAAGGVALARRSSSS